MLWPWKNTTNRPIKTEDKVEVANIHKSYTKVTHFLAKNIHKKVLFQSNKSNKSQKKDFF